MPEVLTGLGVECNEITFHIPAEYESALALLGTRSPALVLAQHDKRLTLAGSYGSLRRTRVLTQGDNAVSFYKTS